MSAHTELCHAIFLIFNAVLMNVLLINDLLQNECTTDWWVDAQSKNRTQAWKDYNMSQRSLSDDFYMYCIFGHLKCEDSQCYVQLRNIKSKPTIILPAPEDLPFESFWLLYWLFLS